MAPLKADSWGQIKGCVCVCVCQCQAKPGWLRSNGHTCMPSSTFWSLVHCKQTCYCLLPLSCLMQADHGFMLSPGFCRVQPHLPTSQKFCGEQFSSTSDGQPPGLDNRLLLKGEVLGPRLCSGGGILLMNVSESGAMCSICCELLEAVESDGSIGSAQVYAGPRPA